MRSFYLILLVLALSVFVLALRPADRPPRSADGSNVVWTTMAFSPDGAQLATSTGTGTLLLWDTATWTPRLRLRPDDTRLHGFHYAPDGQHLSFGSNAGTVFVMDAQTGDLVFQAQDRDQTVSMTRLLADGRVFTSGEGARINSYNWRTGERLQSYAVGLPLVEDFEVLPEQDWLLAARFDGVARLFDLDTGAEVRSWRNSPRPSDGQRNLKDVEVAPDGRTGFFTGVNGRITKVDLETGARLDSVQVHPGFIAELQQAPDGSLLAVNDLDGGTTLIDPETLAIVQRFEQEASFGNRRLLFALAFRPGTSQILTGGIRLPLILWDTDTGERVRTISTSDVVVHPASE